MFCKQFSLVVTPLAGVWIEIRIGAKLLKLKHVTPLAGVWIEISAPIINDVLPIVTPLAGVWIEMKRI